MIDGMFPYITLSFCIIGISKSFSDAFSCCPITIFTNGFSFDFVTGNSIAVGFLAFVVDFDLGIILFYLCRGRR